MPPAGGPVPLVGWSAFSRDDSPPGVLTSPAAFVPPCPLVYQPAIQCPSDGLDHYLVNGSPKKNVGTARTPRGEP